MPDKRAQLSSGPEIKETNLPGVGVRFDFSTESGENVAVVHHRTGRRELVLYEREDPDCSRDVLELTESDSRTLAELLGGAKVAEELGKLQQSVEGLAIDWLPIVVGRPYAGRTIGDTGARTRTGTSIVAVLRGDVAFPAPQPDFTLEGGDTLVVVGTPRGIEDLATILQTG
ncbi:MAG: cation:proton antiporter regulatory subunit [Actinobacteria bacterium]|nr:cation:proton antiporter regulatory subunit [Actinomycetota bacterium]